MNPPRIAPHNLTLVGFLGLLAPALAQTPSPKLPNGAQIPLPLAPDHVLPDMGDAGAAVALDWDGDLRVDVAQLVGDRVYLASGVDIHRTFGPMPATQQTQYLAIGRLPGSPDRLITTHAVSGLEVWGWDGLDGVFLPTPLQSPWTDVTRLCTGDLNGDGLTDIVGLGNTGVRTLVADGTGGFDFGGDFLMDDAVVDLDTLDWNGDGNQEVSVLTSTSLTIWDPPSAGILHQSPSPVGFFLEATRIRKDGPGTDALVLLTEFPGVSQFLHVADAGGAEVAQPIGLADIRSMAGGDADGDGDDDLLAVSAQSPVVYGLENANTAAAPTLAVTYTVDPQQILTFPYANGTRDLSGQDSALIFRDLDRDGDADFALYRAHDSTLIVQRSGLVPEYDHRLHVPHFWFNGSLAGPGIPIRIPTENWPYYASQAPLNPGAESWFHNPDHLEITVWRIDANGDLEPLPVFQGTQPETAVHTDIQALIPEPSALFVHDYAAVIRRVRVDSFGNLLDAGPDSYFTMFVESSPTAVSTGGSNPGPGAPPVGTSPSRPPCNSDC